jgi:hypothetical protein
MAKRSEMNKGPLFFTGGYARQGVILSEDSFQMIWGEGTLVLQDPV